MASKSLLSAFLLLAVSVQPAKSASCVTSLVTIDARHSVTPPQTEYLHMGGKKAAVSLSGHVLKVNSRYLTLDGKPWLPVMGEFHYSRYPVQDWEEEILKMKAGGVQIVSTYVFWIHQEEIEGQFDWAGQRNLRRFVELCAKHGMYVYPRIGPWDHGEVRNGGFPDWLLKKGPVRINDPIFISYVRTFYDQIAKQLTGLLWKDGGPVIGIQLENEYSNRSPDGGVAYILELKHLALDAGLDVPLYTVTGWDNAVIPAHEVIPVFGGYPDEFWAGSLKELPPDVEGMYAFHLAPRTGTVGILQAASTQGKHVDLSHYPWFTAELGGGMETSYHRRPVISANDIAPMALVQLGSGANLLGYYMFHGGTNPEGKLTTLQESQATNYPNDLPVKSYDFQAPLREFGQMNGSFRPLKVINQFVADFGSYLAPMIATLASPPPPDSGDAQPQVAARTEGDHGFVFVSNYVRHYPPPEYKNLQVRLKLPDETLIIPERPFNLPSQSSFFWPVNLDLKGVLLKYATAQPFAILRDGKIEYYFFMITPGVTPEFAFAADTLTSLTASSGKNIRNDGQVYVEGVQPSTKVAIEVRSLQGNVVRIVLLSKQQAEDSWKLTFDGRDHMLLTNADTFADSDNIYLLSRSDSFAFSVFPDFVPPMDSTVPLQQNRTNGIFVPYTASVKGKKLSLSIEKLRNASHLPPVRMGKIFAWRAHPVSIAPDNADFKRAAVWQLKFPKNALSGLSNVFLNVSYVGDVGRFYEGKRLLDDNFCNGTVWEIGLKRFAPQILADGAKLEILPLRKGAPIYIPASAWPKFGGETQMVKINSLRLIPEYKLTLRIGGLAKRTEEK